MIARHASYLCGDDVLLLRRPGYVSAYARDAIFGTSPNISPVASNSPESAVSIQAFSSAGGGKGPRFYPIDRAARNRLERSAAGVTRGSPKSHRRKPAPST